MSAGLAFAARLQPIGHAGPPGFQPTGISGDTYRTLTTVDSAAMVLDAAAKVTKGGIARSRPASSSRFAACVTFVNKLDREGPGLLDEIEQSLALDVTPAPGRSALRRDHRDQRREAPKIHFIEGQQPPLAMRQHGRDDIGVMDLTTSEGIEARPSSSYMSSRRRLSPSGHGPRS